MDIEKKLKELTIKQKATLTSGKDLWHFLGMDDKNIRKIFTADGPHGVRVYNDQNYKEGNFDRKYLKESTLFPSASAMASTFNTSLLELAGQTIAVECNHNNVDILLGPGVNLKRSPLGGRNFEYYSEDPFLSGKMASAFIKGVQSQGVGACIKHFALNEQETLRRYVNSVIDDRTLHELYLLPFEIAIKEANPMAVMSSYNKVNGHYSAENKELLIDILRDKWNYEGLVVSDWTAVHDKVKSVKNGLNVEMPGPSEFESDLIKAYQEGKITEEEIDKSIKPLFHALHKLDKNQNKNVAIDLKQHHLLAREVANESIVLLENDGILPLKKNTRLTVIGSFAENPRINGGGSASLKPFLIESPLTELEKEFKVIYSKGYEEEHITDQLLKEAIDAASMSDVILFFTGTTSSLENEGAERKHMKLPPDHEKLLLKLQNVNKKLVVILNNGSSLDLRNVTANAVIESWFLGGANAVSLVDVITGKVNPSGRLSETFPLCIEHTPFYGAYPGTIETVDYSQDLLRVGYRYYDLHKYPVKYPFGYGLSYTSFEYSNLLLSKKTLSKGETLSVTCTVSNTGKKDGKEVIQVYVRPLHSRLDRPNKELKGFSKVFIPKGTSKDVTIDLDDTIFRVYSTDFKEFQVEDLDYEIIIAKNVNEEVLKDIVHVHSTDLICKPLTDLHPVTEYEKYYQKAVAYLESVAGEIPWFAKELPLQRILRNLIESEHIDEDTIQTFYQMIGRK